MAVRIPTIMLNGALQNMPSGDVVAGPPWYGKLYGALGNCDPQELLNACTLATGVAPTPTGITTTIARCVLFTPPVDIVVNKIRFYGVGVVSGIYQAAIYRVSDLARLTAQLSITTTSGAFGSIGSALNLTLSANTQYFMAVSVNTTGTTAGLLSCSTTSSSTAGAILVAPSAYPGNLASSAGCIVGGFQQFTVTAGALPATAPTPVAPTAWTGGFPAFWLDNNNA